MHHPIIKPNHMQIPWHDPIRDQKELPVSQAPLPIRAGVVGRVGLLLLSCGTGAWRVRSSMNEIAEALGLVCAADIGLLSIEYTCSDGENTFAQTLTLTATGVNTAKLDQLERFVKRFPLDGVYMTADDLHTRLDEIAQAGGSYTLTDITRNGQPLRDDDTVTVTCLAVENQMEALLASESGRSLDGDTWVKNRWRDHLSGGGAALAEPENYMTLR